MSNFGWGPSMSEIREANHARYMAGKTCEEWAAIAADIKSEMDDRSKSRGPDEYHDLKDRYWQAVARSKNTTEMKINPMNYWFGRQSN